MAKPNRIPVISPIDKDGSFQFWDRCRTGKMPREGKPDKASLTFDLGYSYWDWRREVDARVGIPNTAFFTSDHFRKMQKTVFRATIKVMKRHGFTGTCKAVGIARRDNKRPWEFSLRGVNFTCDEHFILAKLMDKDQFRNEIWNETIRMTWPNVAFKEGIG
jgi:hypothetical protein